MAGGSKAKAGSKAGTDPPQRPINEFFPTASTSSKRWCATARRAVFWIWARNPVLCLGRPDARIAPFTGPQSQAARWSPSPRSRIAPERASARGARVIPRTTAPRAAAAARDPRIVRGPRPRTVLCRRSTSTSAGSDSGSLIARSTGRSSSTLRSFASSTRRRYAGSTIFKVVGH
jgi:hypothetical protein